MKSKTTEGGREKSSLWHFKVQLFPFHVVEPAEQTLTCLSNFSKEHLTAQRSKTI